MSSAAVKKTKPKIGKKEKMTGEEYPGEINPFESSQNAVKSGKNGKFKGKKKKNKDSVGNPEGNPFLEDDEKVKKQNEKKKKEMLKKEQKREKKELKQKRKSESSDANCNIVIEDKIPMLTVEKTKNISSTLPSNRSPDGIPPTSSPWDGPFSSQNNNTSQSKYNKTQISRTLDVRDSEYDAPKDGQFANMPPKRVLQLKGYMEPSGQPNRSSLPDLTRAAHYETGNLNENNGKTNNDVTKSSTPLTVTSQSHTSRPLSLELKRNNQYSHTTLSPLREERTPSPLANKHVFDNKEVKMYRTSSISKKGKQKKKMRILAKRLKKKKKNKKGGENTAIIEDQGTTAEVVMRKPRVNIQELQKEVDQVRASIGGSIINLVEQRNSALDNLAGKTKELEEFSLGFARTAKEARLKHQARANCCGIGSKWRVCWYICACEGRLKRKKKNRKQRGTEGAPESRDLLEDDDDYYRPAKPTEDVRKEGGSSKSSERGSNGSNIPKSTSVQDLSQYQPQAGDRVGSAGPPKLRNKLLKMPKAMRFSMPQLTDIPMGGNLRSMAKIDPRERKSSSVNALHEIVKKRGEKKRRERQEKDISKFASQYDDEETRKKVEDLLRLDM